MYNANIIMYNSNIFKSSRGLNETLKKNHKIQIDFGQIEIKITMYKWCKKKHYLQKNLQSWVRKLEKREKKIKIFTRLKNL